MTGELVSDPEWNGRIEKICLSESYLEKYAKDAEELKKQVSGVELLSDSVFAHVSDTKTPQGILAVVKRKDYGMDDILGKATYPCSR